MFIVAVSFLLWWVTYGGMFLLPISKHCPVKLHKSLLDAEALKPALNGNKIYRVLPTVILSFLFKLFI